MIEAENLVKNYGSTRAVKGVSFRVEPGEVIGLLGPNGSGKTTIMRMITGFFPPTSGEIRVCGLDVGKDSLEARRRIGYLPENVSLYPDLPVKRFLKFCAEVKGLRGKRKRERVAQVMEDVGLVDVQRKEIGKLSKGYRQRVGIAQALVSEPEVLILDEPTVGLDPAQVVEIRELIRTLRGKATIMLSTHILPEVSITCDRVMIIHKGNIIAQDTAEGLQARVAGVHQSIVRIDGPRGEVLEALRSMPLVTEAKEQPVVTDPAVRVRLTSEAGESLRRDVAKMVIDRGWGLLEASPVALTLEELFVKLVTDDDADGNRG